MNGFELHGIDHLSPSQVNTFMQAPDFWVAEKLLKRKSPPGPAMFRGIVVENAVAAVLIHGQDVEGAKAEAVADFDKRVAMIPEDVSKERNALPGMIDQALAALDGWGAPLPANNEKGQHKVSLKCNLDDGTSIEFIGYLDFAFGENRKRIVDLKTTHACPSKMSFAHQVQRCVYDLAAADGWGVDFLYVTGKKHAVLSDGNTAEVLATVKAIANRMNRFLKLSADPVALASIVPVIPDSFFWTSPAAKQIRREVFGI